MTSITLKPATAAGVAIAALAALAGCSAGGATDRTVAFQARDYAYAGLDGFAPKAGEKVTFVMQNQGPADHEFEVLDPQGRAIGEIAATSSGQKGGVTLSLPKAGTYRFRCGLADHESRGMTGTFVVR